MSEAEHCPLGIEPSKIRSSTAHTVLSHLSIYVISLLWLHRHPTIKKMTMAIAETSRRKCYEVEHGNENRTKLTRPPFNLRQTTHECMYFRSRDTKDGGHTIDLSYSKTPCCMQTSLSLLYLLCNRSYCRFLLLWPWPWPDDLHIRAWPVSSDDILAEEKKTFNIKAFESYRHTHTYMTDRQTDRCHRN